MKPKRDVAPKNRDSTERSPVLGMLTSEEEMMFELWLENSGP